MTTPRPILVTGAHRSGTTWVGRIIASAPAVAYIHEPFHIHHDTSVCGAQFTYWFTYVCEANEDEFYQHIKATLRSSAASTLASPGQRDTGVGDIPQCTHPARYGMAQVRPLLKDPIAVFSAEWLASRFSTDNLVMIRHPAAFAGSLKVNGWTHPFSHFINQPLLMQRHLQPFEREIAHFATEERDIVDQAALLWNMIHYMIRGYQKAHPHWIYLRHEDLSRDPLGGFRPVFDRLDLEFSARTAEAIRAHSFGPVSEARDLKRSSLANITTWKERLTSAEIGRLKSQVRDISKHFYSDDEW